MTGQMYCMHLETLGLIHVPELHRLSKYCLFFHSNSQKILIFLVRGVVKHFDTSLSLPPKNKKCTGTVFCFTAPSVQKVHNYTVQCRLMYKSALKIKLQSTHYH